MDAAQRRALLDDLHRGRTSRNRDVERFAEPEGRRVLAAYRRVKGVLADLCRPGGSARVRWLEAPGRLAVVVEVPRLRYRRVLVLSPWEAEFLASLGGPGARPGPSDAPDPAGRP